MAATSYLDELEKLKPYLLSLTQAGPEFPTPVSFSSVHKYSTVGLRGFVLKTYRVGGTRFTTREAISEFLQELNEADR